MGFDPISYAMGAKAGGGGTAPVLIPLSVDANGDYAPADYQADGFESVSVEVPAQGLLPHTYSASSLSAVNVAKIIADKTGMTSRVYGGFFAYVALGGTTMGVEFPISASFASARLSITITGGTTTGSMGVTALFNGQSSGGLTATALDLIQSGTVTDLSSVAEQIVSGIEMWLWW